MHIYFFFLEKLSAHFGSQWPDTATSWGRRRKKKEKKIFMCAPVRLTEEPWTYRRLQCKSGKLLQTTPKSLTTNLQHHFVLLYGLLVGSTTAFYHNINWSWITIGVKVELVRVLQTVWISTLANLPAFCRCPYPKLLAFIYTTQLLKSLLKSPAVAVKWPWDLNSQASDQ